MINEKEINFLSNIIDERPLYGVKKIEDLNDYRIIESLEEKEILDVGINIGKKGALLLRFIENYKNAKQYIQIGNCFIGIEDNEFSTVITKYEDEYLIERTSKTLFLFNFFKQNNMLLDKEVIEESEEKVGQLNIAYELMVNEEKIKNIFRVKNIENNIVTKNWLIYSYDNKVYKYDSITEEKNIINCNNIRKEIFNMFYGGKNGRSN